MGLTEAFLGERRKKKRAGKRRAVETEGGSQSKRGRLVATEDPLPLATSPPVAETSAIRAEASLEPGVADDTQATVETRAKPLGIADGSKSLDDILFSEYISKLAYRKCDKEGLDLHRSDLASLTRNHMLQGMIGVLKLEQEAANIATHATQLSEELEVHKKDKESFGLVVAGLQSEIDKLTTDLAKEREEKAFMESNLNAERESRIAAEEARERVEVREAELLESFAKGGSRRIELEQELLKSSAAKRQAYKQGLDLYFLCLNQVGESIPGSSDVLEFLRAKAEERRDDPPSFQSGDSSSEDEGDEADSGDAPSEP